MDKKIINSKIETEEENENDTGTGQKILLLGLMCLLE